MTNPTSEIDRRRSAVLLLVGGYANLVLTAAQGLLSVPFYLHFLGARVYGAWLGSGDILGWLAILNVGMASFIIQRVARAHAQGDGAGAASFAASGLLLQGVPVGMIVLGAVALAPVMPGWMGLGGSEAQVLGRCFIAVAVGVALMILDDGVTGIALAIQRSTFSVIASIACTLAGNGNDTNPAIRRRGPLGDSRRDPPAERTSVLRESNIRARNHFRAALRPRRGVVIEMARLADSKMVATVGNALAGRSEAALIAAFVRPELTTVYVLTRRVMEIGGMTLDRHAGAAFPGFAHLIGTDNRFRAREVHRDITVAFAALTTGIGACYVALNHTFMHLWVIGQEPSYRISVALSESVGADCTPSIHRCHVNREVSPGSAPGEEKAPRVLEIAHGIRPKGAKLGALVGEVTRDADEIVARERQHHSER
jgi:hypothetical protein